MARSRTVRHALHRRWLCALLCLATWRGPLPWIHSHAAEFPPQTAEREFAQHTAIYHDADGVDVLGWHFHLYLPRDVHPVGGPEDPSPVPEDELLAFGALVEGRTGAWTSAPLPAETLAPTVNAIAGDVPTNGETHPGGLVADASHAPTTFLSGLLLSAPLNAVTGVALC